MGLWIDYRQNIKLALPCKDIPMKSTLESKMVRDFVVMLLKVTVWKL